MFTRRTQQAPASEVTLLLAICAGRAELKAKLHGFRRLKKAAFVF
jgi:hypothetical protein